MGACETSDKGGDERETKGSDRTACPASPPIVEFGLLRALKLFAAGVGFTFVCGVLIQVLLSGVVQWTKLGVALGLASILISAAWSLRFRSDARGLERRFLGVRTRWSWDDFLSGRMTIGPNGWAPNTNNVLDFLWRQPYFELGEPPGSEAVFAYVKALFEHAPRPAPEPGKEYRLGPLGRCAFDVSGLRRKGLTLPWTSIDAIEVVLPDRTATRPSSISIRSERIHGTCPLRMGPLAAEAASLLSTLEACVPPAKLTRRLRGEIPVDARGRAELRTKLEARRRGTRWVTVVILAGGLTVAGLFLWGSPGRRFQLWEDGMPLWLNLARLAVLAVVVLLGVAHFLIALYLIRRQARRDEARLRELDEATTSNSPGR